VRFGLIGIGSHVKKNILSIASLSSNPIVSAFSSSKDKLKMLKSYNDFLVFDSKRSFFKSDKFDSVYIATPNATHFMLAKEALLNHKHVLVEKTSFINIDEVNEIIEIANSKNLLVQEAFMYRYHPQLEHLKKTIKSIGDKDYYAEINFCIPRLEDANIRYDVSLGGGALNDTGAYIINIARLFFGLNHTNIDHLSIIKKDGEVDMSGYLKLSKNKQVVNCKWSLEGKYNNSLSLEFGDSKLFYPRIFSKDVLAPAEVYINKKDNQDRIIFNQSNHFINMFSSITNTRSHKAEHASELKSQAEFMSKIRDYY